MGACCCGGVSVDEEARAVAADLASDDPLVKADALKLVFHLDEAALAANAHHIVGATCEENFEVRGAARRACKLLDKATLCLQAPTLIAWLAAHPSQRQEHEAEPTLDREIELEMNAQIRPGVQAVLKQLAPADYERHRAAIRAASEPAELEADSG